MHGLSHLMNWGLPLIMYAPRGRGGGGGVSNLLYISIAYYMQKRGEGVQITCPKSYPINCVNFTIDCFRNVFKVTI